MDLLQSQIKESCNLALPEGLKDLMNDISREVANYYKNIYDSHTVLRARPNNIPQFIADYLEVLLEVRAKLSIACHICNDSCKIICEPELYNELKAIGLTEENIDIAIQIVQEHWDKRNVKEQSLLIKLARKMNIEDMQLPLIRDAIQKAIKIHQYKDDFMSGSKLKDNKVTGGLYHTLDWYRQNKTTTEEVFMAPNFDPCGSIVSSTDPVPYLNLPEYRSAQDKSDQIEKEEEYISLDYTLNTSAGKVQFGEEKIISKTDSDKEIRTSDGKNVNDDINHEDHNDIADDKNVMDDEADNDIKEFIINNSTDDTESSSSVDEDFVAVSE